MDTSPFHAGERALQEQAGVRERMDAVGRSLVRDHLPAQHREFFALLPTLLVAALDAGGQPWATALHGPPGFASSPDERHLQVQARPAADDPLAGLLEPGRPIGLLGLQPHSRRRNRLNGEIVAADEAGLRVRVRQSFGNCPKYIHPRRPEPLAAGPGLARDLGPALDAEALALIGRADTLFIASAAAPAGPLDMSHRGGEPGFVACERTDGGVVLRLPDYPGNQMFCTLGNLLLHPRAGLLFVDPERGDLLHLAAQARVAGPRQPLRLEVAGARWRPRALPLRWVDTGPADGPHAAPG